MSGDPKIEEHLQKTEDQRDPLGRKHDAAEAAAPNPTQKRMDEEGTSRQPVDIPWWRRLLAFGRRPR
jgi:hypothetical protein